MRASGSVPNNQAEIVSCRRTPISFSLQYRRLIQNTYFQYGLSRVSLPGYARAYFLQMVRGLSVKQTGSALKRASQVEYET